MFIVSKFIHWLLMNLIISWLYHSQNWMLLATPALNTLFTLCDGNTHLTSSKLSRTSIRAFTMRNLSAEILQMFIVKFFSSFSRMFWLFWVLRLSMWISKLAYQYLQRNQPRFCYGLCWICRSVWGNITIWTILSF